jgi:hypothetical protein
MWRGRLARAFFFARAVPRARRGARDPKGVPAGTWRGYDSRMSLTRRQRRRAAWAACWAGGIVLLVAGTGLGVWRFTNRAGAGNPAVAIGPDGKPLPPTPARLTRGDDYYLYVKLIELADKTPKGKSWDIDGSGPDIKFRLTWRKNVIWDSVEKKDTLIGSWDLMKIDLRAVIASGGQAELEGALNAPLVHYEPGETVELLVWDNDSVGSDDAGKIVLRLDELSPGEQTIAPAGGDAKAIKRVVLAMIDRKTPVPELIQTMSNR